MYLKSSLTSINSRISPSCFLSTFIDLFSFWVKVSLSLSLLFLSFSILSLYFPFWLLQPFQTSSYCSFVDTPAYRFCCLYALVFRPHFLRYCLFCILYSVLYFPFYLCIKLFAFYHHHSASFFIHLSIFVYFMFNPFYRPNKSFNFLCSAVTFISVRLYNSPFRFVCAI